MKEAKGIIAATITPMRQDETINLEALGEIINWQIACGVHGICTVNSVGEYFALNKEEMVQIFKYTVETVKGRVPVYLGTAANSTRETIALTRTAKDCGADFVSIITPSFIRPNDDELYLHFSEIAKAVDIPIVLYNNPQQTGNVISVNVLSRLANDYENIVGIKDGSGSLSQALQYIRHSRPGFAVLCGQSALMFASLCSGATGAIASVANIAPDLLVRLYHLINEKKFEEALALDHQISAITEVFGIGASFPANVKEVCNLIGKPAGPTRRPVKPYTGEQAKMAREILLRAGLEVVPNR